LLDRHEAGRQLAERVALRALAQPFHDPLVLALPRGGVPVALEIAEAIDAPLDVLLVRKLGAPGFAELGLGAIVDGPNPQRILNQRIIDAVQPPPGYLEAEEKRQYEVLAQRKRRLRQGHPPEPVQGRDVILVDDGVATGSTMRVALKALAGAGARSVLVAVPVAPAGAHEALGIEAERFECLLMPEDFQAVGNYYVDFAQLTDDEVVALLARSRQRDASSPVAVRPSTEASGAVVKR
jgi:putative phosphoribosyl transferase